MKAKPFLILLAVGLSIIGVTGAGLIGIGGTRDEVIVTQPQGCDAEHWATIAQNRAAIAKNRAAESAEAHAIGSRK